MTIREKSDLHKKLRVRGREMMGDKTLPWWYDLRKDGWSLGEILELKNNSPDGYFEEKEKKLKGE